MAPSTRPVQGSTLVKLIVVLAVIVVLVSLALPGLIMPSSEIGAQFSFMNNARQIQIATMFVATYAEAHKDPQLVWPGDLKAAGRIANLSDYVTLLVRDELLKPSDLKVFSAAGLKPYEGMLSSGSNGGLFPAFKDENCALKVYLVKKDDPADTIFLVSKNYTYNTPLNDSKAKPFGDKGFVVIRKDGSAGIFKKAQAQALNLVGQLPGGGTVESAENCLNPSPATP